MIDSFITKELKFINMHFRCLDVSDPMVINEVQVNDNEVSIRDLMSFIELKGMKRRNERILAEKNRGL